MLNLIINLFRKQPHSDETQLTRLVNMRAAASAAVEARAVVNPDVPESQSCECGDHRVHATLTRLKDDRAFASEHRSEKYGRKFWSNSGETYKSTAEREAPAAVRESVMTAVRDKENDCTDPLARAEMDWDAWNTGEHAAHTDEHWLKS